MAPYLRSFAAQVHRQVRSIGSRRNFSSASDPASTAVPASRGAIVARVVAAICGTHGGYCLGDVPFGDLGAKFRKKHEKNTKYWEECAEEIEEILTKRRIDLEALNAYDKKTT